MGWYLGQALACLHEEGLLVRVLALVSVDDVDRDEEEDGHGVDEEIANGGEGIVHDFHVRIEERRERLRQLWSERGPGLGGFHNAIEGEGLDREGELAVNGFNDKRLEFDEPLEQIGHLTVEHNTPKLSRIVILGCEEIGHDLLEIRGIDERVARQKVEAVVGKRPVHTRLLELFGVFVARGPNRRGRALGRRFRGLERGRG